MAEKNCVGCKFGSGVTIGQTRFIECIHPDIRGLLRCEQCNRWSLLETFVLKDKTIRCPRDGCRHCQSLPSGDDSREGFIGTIHVECKQLEPPHWCPGFEARIEAREPVGIASADTSPDEADPAPRRTRKRKQKAKHTAPSLFD